MANPNLVFIKKALAATATAPDVVNGGIWFNPTTGLISVGDGGAWKNVSGVQDASFDANKKLTIVKHDGSKVELDFSDVASAQVLGTLRTDLNGFIEKVNGIEDNITTINGNISTINREIDALQTAVGEGAEGLGTKVANLENAVKEINETTIPAVEEELRGEINTVDGKVDANIQSIGTINGEIRGIKTAAETLAGRVTTAEGEIDALQTHATNYEARVQALETEVAGVNGMEGTTRIDALETLAGENKAAIESNDDEIAAIKTAIGFDNETSVDVRVENIEKLIADDGKVDTINNITEVMKWFEGVNESDTGAALLTDVAANKSVLKGYTGDSAVKNDVQAAKEAADAAQSAADAKVASVTATDDTIVVNNTDSKNPKIKVADGKFDAAGAAANVKSTVLGTTDGVDFDGTVKGAYEAASAAKAAADAAQAAADTKVESEAFEAFKTTNTADIAAAKKAGTDAAAALETYKSTNDVAVAANTNAVANHETRLATAEKDITDIKAALRWATWE